MSDLYKVTVGEDVYLGAPEEVVQFMARAEGAPGGDIDSYMAGIAQRVSEQIDVGTIETDDPVAFLESLQEAGVIRIDVQGAPSDQRTDPEEALGDGPIAYGPNVDPRDVDIG